MSACLLDTSRIDSIETPVKLLSYKIGGTLVLCIEAILKNHCIMIVFVFTQACVT